MVRGKEWPGSIGTKLRRLRSPPLTRDLNIPTEKCEQPSHPVASRRSVDFAGENLGSGRTKSFGDKNFGGLSCVIVGQHPRKFSARKKYSGRLKAGYFWCFPRVRAVRNLANSGDNCSSTIVKNIVASAIFLKRGDLYYTTIKTAVASNPHHEHSTIPRRLLFHRRNSAAKPGLPAAGSPGDFRTQRGQWPAMK